MGKYLGHRKAEPKETFFGGGSGILMPFNPRQMLDSNEKSSTPPSATGSNSPAPNLTPEEQEEKQRLLNEVTEMALAGMASQFAPTDESPSPTGPAKKG